VERPSTRGAGSALPWQALQLIGTKFIFVVRLVVLARLLSPDDFGLLVIAMIAIGVSNRLTDLEMIPTLVQSEREEDGLYDVAWTVGMVRAVAIGVFIYLCAPLIAELFSDPRAAALMRVLALQPMLEALASIRVVDFIRQRNFRSVTLIRLPTAVSNTVVAIALAPSLGVWALVAGALAGPATSLLLSYVLAPYRPRISLNPEAAGSLIRFGRWIFLAGIAALISSAILRLVISRQLGTVELGLYYLAASLAFIPSEVMSHVVGAVTFPLYSRLQDSRVDLARTFRSVLASLAALLVPPCFLLIALSPGLVEFALGEKLHGTVPIIQILGAVSIISLLGEIVAPILKGAGRPKGVAVIESVQAVILISVVGFFATKWGVTGPSWLGFRLSPSRRL
jgi:O-antigen/teichoic acid export membrane protein